MLPERYRLEGGIAAGGMAAVYAAHDTVLNRPVAVKFLAEHLNDDVVARQRFAREARAAAALSSHSGVVTIFDVGEHEGRSFLVMERREGGTLADVGRVAPERALAWLRTVADALDAAHDAGVVHRDIKPANLLRDEYDHVAVADFGIASIADETDRFTETGQVLGTAAYLSPEQAAGEPATPASDRYALAVVAYELLTGTKPFTASHFAAQARAHIEDPPPPAPGLSRAAQRVLARGLAKDPGARWPSAAGFVEALAKTVDAPRDATEPTRPLGARPTATSRAPASVLREPRRRDRRPTIAVAAATVVVAAVAVALFANGGNDHPQAAHAKPTRTATPHPTRTATAAPSASPSPAATAGPSPAPTSATSAGALNGRGFRAIQAGDYAGAVAPLQEAVKACDGHGQLDPCGFAYYNLGVALNRSGHAADAVPYLEARLKIWGDNASRDVHHELEDARKPK